MRLCYPWRDAICLEVVSVHGFSKGLSKMIAVRANSAIPAKPPALQLDAGSASPSYIPYSRLQHVPFVGTAETSTE